MAARPLYSLRDEEKRYGFASSIIAFLRLVNCIVDSPPSNICILLVVADEVTNATQGKRKWGQKPHNNNIMSSYTTSRPI